MSKSKTRKAPSKTRKAPAGAKAPASKQVVVISYAVFAFKNGGGIKSPIENEAAGKQLLKDIYVSLDQGKPYLNEERGLLLNPNEISHTYLAQEQKA